MSVKRMWMALLLMGGALMAGCEETGPGMTVTWETLDREHYVALEEIRLPSGAVQEHSVSITRRSRATESFAPDNRMIPQWVELAWIEPVDYPDEVTAPPLQERVAAIRQLPLKRQRVEVGSRIPKEVIAQAVEAVKNRRPGELSDRYIWIYFTWHEGRVSFRWELLDRTLERGGKVIASGA